MAVLTRLSGPPAGPSDLADWSDGVHYPSSDGAPMGETGWQVDWITLVYGELKSILPVERALVAADLFWYPLRGRPAVCAAPDVMVVLGRPGHLRRSYRQWEEDHVAPAVVFEFVSESNDRRDLAAKRNFSERYGVREHYTYDPRPGFGYELRAWERVGGGTGALEEVNLPAVGGWRSPLLGITFAREGGPGSQLRLLRPDGQPFRTSAEKDQVLAQKNQALAQQDQALAQERAARSALLAKLRAAGIDPDTL